MSVLPFHGNEFDHGLRGHTCWLELADGGRIELPSARWQAALDSGDELMLARCTGPCLDVGCGPGRLTAELAARGVLALGIDVSMVAVRQTRQRGGAAIQRDVFARVPGTGRWRDVLLADGNIGIGGDPAGLLRRISGLAAPRARILVELEPPGTGLRSGAVRVRGSRRPSRWFPWAWLGADSVTGVARLAGFDVAWTRETAGRWFAELTR